MNCPDCDFRMSIEKTANFTGRALRVEQCPCGSRFETETKVIRRLPATACRRKREPERPQMTASNLSGSSGSDPDLSSGPIGSLIGGDQGVDRPRVGAVEYPDTFEELWESTGRRGVKFKALKAWKARGKPSWPEVSSRWAAYLISERPAKGFVQDLSTWLNGRGHLQDWEPFAVPRNGHQRDLTLGHVRAEVKPRTTGEVDL